jgi:hypothetical protein
VRDCQDEFATLMGKVGELARGRHREPQTALSLSPVASSPLRHCLSILTDAHRRADRPLPLTWCQPQTGSPTRQRGGRPLSRRGFVCSDLFGCGGQQDRSTGLLRCFSSARPWFRCIVAASTPPLHCSALHAMNATMQRCKEDIACRSATAMPQLPLPASSACNHCRALPPTTATMQRPAPAGKDAPRPGRATPGSNEQPSWLVAIALPSHLLRLSLAGTLPRLKKSGKREAICLTGEEGRVQWRRQSLIP